MFWLLLEYYGTMSKKRKAKLRIFAVHFLRFDSFSKSHRLWRGELGKLEIGMCVHAMIAHHLGASLGKFGDLVGIWKIQTGTNLPSFVPTLFFTGGKAVGIHKTNIFHHEQVCLMYYEHWINKQKYFYVNIFHCRFCLIFSYFPFPSI